MQQRMGRNGPMGAPYQGQGRILSLLKLKPEISQKDLTHILNIRSQSLGELLAKLERSGYITRTPSQIDRRAMEIRLTESGRAVAEKDEEPARTESLFDCLNEEEQATLSDYLERLNQRLEEQLAAGEPDRSSGRGPDFRGRGPGDFFHRGGPPDERGFDRFFGGDPSQFPFGDRGPESSSRDKE